MKRTILILAFLQLCVVVFAQERITITDDAFIVIDNSAFVVIDNPNVNALSTSGTGGNIVSESETDLIKWNVSTATGVHTIPWTNASGVKIPLAINITGAGSAGGSLLLSTYGTNNGNTTWPTVAPAVNDMCSFTYADDASLKVIDRFWRIDANSYGTKPAVNLNFGYDFTNEGGGTNVIDENNLQAQRYNPTTGSGNTACFSAPGTGVSNGTWEGLLFGTVNTGTKKVNTAAVSSANFYKDWILVDNTTPLPVNLVSFKAKCEKGGVIIDWITASETNNDYFVVEKSYDANSFFELTTLQGTGNSSVNSYYSATDSDNLSEVTYYRLKQVDFDGSITYHEIIPSKCNTNDFVVDKVVLNNNALKFDIITSQKEEVVIYLYDYKGRLISSKKHSLLANKNAIQLNNLEISKSIYLLSIVGQYNTYSTKLVKR